MKTAMQELLEAYDECKTSYDFNDWLCNNEKKLLEKEKEQIIDAFNEGIDEMAFATSGINYYNQTYNQNK